MIDLIFSKVGADDVVLSENDLFDFSYEHSCFSGDTFELGGVNARQLNIIIDNNGQWYSRGTFANTRVRLEVDGEYIGTFNCGLPKRRNGAIEITAYDDMTKLDVAYPTDYEFPQTFNSVYVQCLWEAGLIATKSHDEYINNGVFHSGLISHEYTEYIYANSCRQLVAGMAEWNGGFCFINSDGKLQIQAFAKDISKEFKSSELMDLDYSDETVTFTKIKTAQKNKVYEMGTDDGYTLVIQNQYIQYGLEDTNFEMFMGTLYDYYNGFTLTPMSFTLTEPDFSLNLGDRISVYDEEEDITVTGNISKIQMSGNLSMTITCGEFNVSSGYNPTSASQTGQAQTSAQTNPIFENMTIKTPTTSQDGWSIKSSIGAGEVYGNATSIGLAGMATELKASYTDGIALQGGNARVKINGAAYAEINGGGVEIDTNESNGGSSIRIKANGALVWIRDGVGMNIEGGGASIALSNAGDIRMTTSDTAVMIGGANGITIKQGNLSLKANDTGLFVNDLRVLTEADITTNGETE